MKSQSRRDRLEESVWEVFYNKSSNNNSVTLDELCNLTGISREKIKKIIYVLATRDHVPIGLLTSPPYRFYIKK